MNPPTSPALTNPFRHTRSERYGLYFASNHSYIAPAGWSSRNRFQFWVLDIGSETPMRLRVGRQEIVRPPHSVVLYAPHVTYEEFLEASSLLRMSWLMFRVTDHRSPLSRLVRPDGFRVFEDPASLVRPLIESIISCFLNPIPAGDWFARSAFYQILALLQSAQGEPARCIRQPQLAHGLQSQSLRGQAEVYLRAHPRGHVTASEMAAHLRLSLSSFTHRYHEEAGETFGQTKTRAKIELAKSLLLQGEMSIKQVALELGFSDTPHFSRTFLRVVGMSPVHFKEELGPRFQEKMTPIPRGKRITKGRVPLLS